MSIIEIENLTKYYPKPENPGEKFAAVDHISLKIKEGETFAGPLERFVIFEPNIFIG